MICIMIWQKPCLPTYEVLFAIIMLDFRCEKRGRESWLLKLQSESDWWTRLEFHVSSPEPLSRCHILAISSSVLMERLSWPEKNGYESAAERRREKESTPSLWKVCDILKELWRWIMTGLINSSLLFSLSYGNLFCHSVMRISLKRHKDQAPLIKKNHLLLKDVVFCDKLQYSCLFFSFFCRREYIRFMRSRIISLEGLERKTPKP